ncbi:hypothetical protein BRADI_2g33991v3 [Brachypodium distachyon]|uniref:Peptidase S8/S53 domain-containing protein n=1 Tax=Brachypodium distachyon TaxID=15368 RepID=A0A2K2DBN9_BRADI|nr:hypothetical protein BRADI_2g33991v3 [Brachypodium distachyon]
MASFTSILLPFLLMSTLTLTPTLCYINPATPVEQKDGTKTSAGRTYIVLVEPPRLVSPYEHRQWHESFLPSPCTDDSGKPCLLHSYTEAFSGFAARLTDAELDVVAKKPGFVRAFPDRLLQPMTTHTPEFLGLRTGSTGFWSHARYGKGVIIGLLDTGIYAKHPSFDDHGIPPPPARWKGSCKADRCNNKLIGAVSFVGDKPGDDEGHGTHTSSTAAGNFVAGASDLGVGAGTAAGIAPGAHIAMYKVCDRHGCTISTVLAGLEKAIKDGVDVLSLSLGSDISARFDLDPIAMGAFNAISKGIIVVCSAGNHGPHLSTVNNAAPWLLTVGASSVDRSFDAAIHLGNGKSIDGQALNQMLKPSPKPYPLLYSEEQRRCSYDGDSVVGKIVLCEFALSATRKSKIQGIMDAGAAGVVLFNDRFTGYATILTTTPAWCRLPRPTVPSSQSMRDPRETLRPLSGTRAQFWASAQPPSWRRFLPEGQTLSTPACSSRTYWHRG